MVVDVEPRGSLHNARHLQWRVHGELPSGKQVTITAVNIHLLAGGKMVEDWEWSDNLGFMQQLGLISLPKLHTE